MRRLILGLLFVLTGQLTYAQVTTTTVTATVLDPNKVPYANGRGTATHISGPNSTGRSIGQVPFSMDANGAFTIRLLTNTGGGQWRFDICTPSVGTVSNCFNLTLTITGASQDISSALNAASVPMESAPFDGINSAFTINRNYGDYFGISPPPNPLAGYYRLYVNSGTGLLECKQSSGATCLPAGSGGSVASVGLTGPGGIFSVSGSPVTGTGTFGLTLAGNSGGITYLANGTTLASSATMPANTYIKGGGAGAAPSPGTILDDGTNPVQSPNGLTVMSNGYYYQITNANPGTSTNLLVCRNSIGRAITCPTGTNHAVAGVAGQGAGNSGSVQVCIVGSCTVTFDNQSVVNDTAIPSPTVAGQVHDTGSMAQPAGVQSFLVTGTNAGVGTPTTIDVITPDSGTTGGFNNPMTTLCDEIVGGVAGAAVRLPCPTAVAGVPQLESSTPSGGIGQTKVWAPVGIVPRFNAGPTDTVAATDRAQIIDYTAAATVTIPQAGTTGFAGNYFTCVQVDKASLGNVTFTPTVSLLDGASTALTLGPGQGTCFFTNNTNWFSRNTNVAAVNDLNVLGPNPWYDLRRYGLYSGAGPTLTCSATASNTTLNCGSAGDFVLGQGIEIPLAGLAPTFPTWGTTNIDSYSRSGNVATYHVTSTVVGPPQTITITGLADSSFNVVGATILTLNNSHQFTIANVGANVGATAGTGVGTLTSSVVTVTPVGILNGTTRYDYKVVMRDYNGALSAASPAGITTVGAVVGPNVINVNSCARAAGIVTCITAAAHNVQIGTEIALTGTSTNVYDGEHVVASTPNATTFTYDAFGQQDDPGPPTGGTITVPAKNIVRWNMQEDKQLQAFIYRSSDSGATWNLVGITEGMDGAFVDWNASSFSGGRFIAAQASYISTTVPTATPVNGILAGRITSISGNNITLDTAATATVASQPTKHDNAPVIIAGCNALGAGGSGNLYIAVSDVYFNSILNMRDKCAWPNPDKVKILVNSARLFVNEPIVLRMVANYWESIGGNGPLQSFSSGAPTSEVLGNAYPFFYLPTGNGPSMLKNFLMDSYNVYQSGVVEDQNATGRGTVNTEYDNVYFNGYDGAMPFIARGGAFWHRWRRAIFNGAPAYGTPEPLLITIPFALGTSGAGYILGGDMVCNECMFIGHGALYETWGQSGQSANFVTYTDTLYESGTSPLLRFNMGPGGIIQGLRVMNPSYSDSVNVSTPMIELGVSNALVGGVHVYNPQCAGPLFAGGGGGIEVTGGVCDIIGATSYALGINKGSGSFYQSGDVGIAGGQFFIQMVNPAPIVSLVQSAGGSVDSGIQYYSIVATDINKRQTLASLPTPITVGGGNHTVTLTPPTLPVGATGYQVFRSPNTDATVKGVLTACGQLSTPILPNVAFVDTISNATLCGVSSPVLNRAAISAVTAAGISTPSLKLTPGTFVDDISAPITTNRTQVLPDVSGIVPVSSYLNSGYDSGRRGNGAIGSNWAMQRNGLSITSNVIFGTVGAARNIGNWNPTLPFATTQFAQATIGAIGTGAGAGSDDEGVATNILPGVTGSYYYKCVENTTLLILHKIVADGTDLSMTTALSGANGDTIRLENSNGVVLTCTSKSASGVVTTITTTDVFLPHPPILGGSPGILIDGTSGGVTNWSGGNVHPLTHLDAEQDWTQPQHFNGWTDRGVPFSALGTPANGTFYFCPDCVVASPCAGSGTGALAKRLNGAWVCN